MSDKYQLEWVKEAISDLEECRNFLKSKNPKAAKNAVKRIIEVTKLLVEQPYLGNPIDDMPEFQKINIPFGKYGYVLKYRLDGQKIVILRIWAGRQEKTF
ncbi:MAG: type II toxin-antitoxin system RelE/ParE family toxin [Methyloprofundus sp.]|nr:type II toxin-antitoxin system RelE/ParE family toxin [Methyloprofundus sp.]